MTIYAFAETSEEKIQNLSQNHAGEATRDTT